jgi:hypothetical protein
MTIEAMLSNSMGKKIYLGEYIKKVYVGLKMPLSENDNLFRLGKGCRVVGGPQTHHYYYILRIPASCAK